MSAVKIGGKAKALLNVDSISTESVRAISRAILEILAAPHCDESTKVAALNALGRLGPASISVSNATFTGPV